MKHTLSNLGPALFFAAAILLASALIKAAPHATWAAIASPALLVLVLIGTDLVQRRRFRPSAIVLVLAATFVVACGLLASRGLDQLAPMIPILGSSVMLPLVLRAEGRQPSCRQAQP
jgi:MFS superfamily sulfate permease-like transporter